MNRFIADFVVSAILLQPLYHCNQEYKSRVKLIKIFLRKYVMRKQYCNLVFKKLLNFIISLDIL